MKLPPLPEVKVLPTGKDIIISMIQAKEQFLSTYRVDNYNITRRREGSRTKHLGTIRLEDVTKDKLKKFYLHLVTKHLGVL